MIRWTGRTVSLALLFCLSSGVQAQSTPAAQHEQQAQQYLRTHQPELARKEFEAVLAADPDNLNAQANLGVLRYFAGEAKSAEPHLRAALQRDPTLGKLQALLGLSERRNGEFDAARKDLAAALPGLDDPKIRKQVGLELLELQTAANDLPAAAVTVNQIKASFPTDAEVLYAAYRVYTDLAGESMLDLSLAAPDSAPMHQAMAHELLRERDNAAAIANLRLALKADPNLPGGHFELAEVLAASADPALKAEAVEQYQLAFKANPNDDKTLTRFGDLAADKGDHAAAMAHYRDALALNPGNADAKLGLAHELAEKDDPNAALPLLLAVLQEDPANLLAHYRLSALYRRLHRAEDSKREVDEYQRLKASREKLRTLYKSMRLDSPQTTDATN